MADGTAVIVSGAPGAGKTTTFAAVQAILREQAMHGDGAGEERHGPPLVAFDIDSVLPPVNALIGGDLCLTPSAWPRYNDMWRRLLYGVVCSGAVPLLFSPLDPSDLTEEWHEMKMPAHTGHADGDRGTDPIRTLFVLLDCADAEEHRRRLEARRGWSAERRGEAMQDAADLRDRMRRGELHGVVDTSGGVPPQEVARELVHTVRRVIAERACGQC